MSDTNGAASPNAGISQLVTVNQNGVIAIGTLIQAIKSVFATITGTSATATAGSATLPATPAGFIAITLPNGSVGKVPYYNV